MTDRPTGPATLPEAESRLGSWVHGQTPRKTFDAEQFETWNRLLADYRSAVEARILAALPEALLESGMSEWSDSIEGESVVFGGTVAELAAALSAAIERVLG